MPNLTKKQRMSAIIGGTALAIAGFAAGVTSIFGAVDAADIAFEAQFGTPADFYDNFDRGFSGQNPLAYGDGVRSFHGDHSVTAPSGSCGGPTTDRTVNFTGTPTALNFGELFWWCAPTGESGSGHVMTGLDTVGYNTAWFSPKPTFTGIQKVCWDINATTMGARKWWTVLFVGTADATRYPAGTPLNPSVNNQVARGTGGFDLGYTDPDFREPDPNNGVFPAGGTLAGYRDIDRSAGWFQNQSTWTEAFVGPHSNLSGTEKATRYKHCLEQTGANTITITQDQPGSPSTLVRSFPGQIPQDARRVVFSDDNYNPTKDDRLNPLHQTWHWDNIQVFAESDSPGPTTTVPAPTTTTTATTVPTTTTSTTTTLPSTTTTTAPLCPLSFAADAQAWCAEVNARLDALEG
jgi:hypothetical protein